jgi:hypothetical protein
MTLDIEKERPLFEAAMIESSKGLPAPNLARHPGDRGYSGYVDPRAEHALVGWLLAKRTAAVRAEPVPMKDAPARIYLVIEDGGDAYSSFADAREQANMSDGIKWCEDRFSDRDVPYVRADFIAPPAPVSAEPVKHASAEDYLRGKYGAYRGHHAWRELEQAFNAGVASAPPSTDAKDSVGAQMANVMFNMSQMPGQPITQEHCKIMDGLRKRWDAAIAAKGREP